MNKPIIATHHYVKLIIQSDLVIHTNVYNAVRSTILWRLIQTCVESPPFGFHLNSGLQAVQSKTSIVDKSKSLKNLFAL